MPLVNQESSDWNLDEVDLETFGQVSAREAELGWRILHLSDPPAELLQDRLSAATQRLLAVSKPCEREDIWRLRDTPSEDYIEADQILIERLHERAKLVDAKLNGG